MKRTFVFPLTVVAIVAVAAVMAAYHAGTRRETRIAVPFEISKSGHQVVTVVSRGRTLRLMLDTGSSGNILTAAAADRLGLRATSDAGTASGLGSTSYRLRRLDAPLVVDAEGARFEVNRMTSLDLIFAGDDAGEETFDGLLGSPFFLAHRVTIDFAARRIVFDPMV